MTYCSPDRELTFFDTPSFYSTTLHCLSVIAIPMQIFGSYCILFRTPPRMKSVKWSLLNLHFWSCIADVGLSLLTTPFTLTPIFAEYPLGILNLIGVPPEYQVYFITTIGAVMGVAIAGIFENRYHVLNSKNHWWRRARIPWAVVNYLIALTYSLPVFYKLPDPALTDNFVFKRLPCIQNALQPAELFLIAEDPSLYSSLGGSIVLFLVMQMIIFYHSIHRIFRQNDGKLSVKTIEMQRKLMRTLILQLAIPICIIVVPLAYGIIAFICGYYNQALNNLEFIVISCYGFLSTISMIFMHPPYRQVVLKLFRKPSLGTSFATNPVTARKLTVFNMLRNSKFT